MLFLFLPLLAFANNETEEYCAKEPYPVSGNGTTLISNITGANFFATKAIENSIQKSLKKDLKSSFNIEVYPFSVVDLNAGKFKKITIKANNINAPDFSLSDFRAESMCPYNRIAVIDDNLFFAENFLLDYNAKITNSNLKQTVLSTKYLNMINKMDINITGFTLFKIKDPDIEIKNNRVYISFKLLYSTFIKNFEKNISLNTSLKIQDEKIVFSDIRIGENQGISSNILFYILNALNPFNQKVKIDDNNTAYIRTKELEIIDNTVETHGIVILKKNYTAE